nr:hypothetical protein [Crucivirus sp.]
MSVSLIVSPGFGNAILIPANTFSLSGVRIFISVTYSNFSGAIVMPGTVKTNFTNLLYYNNGTAVATVSGSPSGDGMSYQTWLLIADSTLDASIAFDTTGTIANYVCNITVMSFY